MKRHLRLLGPVQGDDLFPAVEGVWKALPEESLDRLVASFVDRCEQVLDVYGESITPYLSGHRRPPHRIWDPPSSWSDADDQQLMNLYEQHGAKWTRIAHIMERRPNSVKNRYKTLVQIQRNQQHISMPELPGIEGLPLDPGLEADFQASVFSQL